MRDERSASEDDAMESGPPGSWLTYRYRLGGPGTREASGTIKAPAFLAAARRLIPTRLGEHLGPDGGYLRLRAAGQEEVLFRVRRDGGRVVRFEVVPASRWTFAPADLGAPDDD